MSEDEHKQIADWVASAPPVVARIFRGNILGTRALKELRRQCFQLIGCYDGSISDQSRASFQEQYDALDLMCSTQWGKTQQ
jgi:hypothetical protein